MIDDLVQQAMDGNTVSYGIVEIIKSGASQETIDEFVEWCADNNCFDQAIKLCLTGYSVLAVKKYFNEKFLIFLAGPDGGRLAYDDLELYFTYGFFDPAVVEFLIANAVSQGDLNDAQKYLAWRKSAEFTAEEIEQLIAAAIKNGFIGFADDAAKLRKTSLGLTQEEFDRVVENAVSQNGSWNFDCSRLSSERLEIIIASYLDHCFYDKASCFAKWRRPNPGLRRAEWQKLVDGLPKRVEEFKKYQEENWLEFQRICYSQLLITMINNGADEDLIIGFIKKDAKIIFESWGYEGGILLNELLPNLSLSLKGIFIKVLSDISDIQTFYYIPRLAKKLYGQDIPADIIEYLIASAIRCGDMYNAVSLVQLRVASTQLTDNELEQLKQGIALMHEKAKQKQTVAPTYHTGDSDCSWSSDERINGDVSPWQDLGRALGDVAADVADKVVTNIAYYWGRLSRKK